MKLSLAKDLAPVRAEAIAHVNATAERLAQHPEYSSPCPTLHRANADAAREFVNGGPLHAELIREAGARGIDRFDHARSIIAKVDEVRSRLLAIDANRRATIAAINAATSEQAIRAILAAL